MSHWFFSTLQVFPRLFIELLDVLVQQEQNVPGRLKRYKNGTVLTQTNRSEKPPRPSGTPPKEGNFVHSSIALISNHFSLAFQKTHYRQKKRNCHLIPLPWRGGRRSLTGWSAPHGSNSLIVAFARAVPMRYLILLNYQNTQPTSINP